MIPDRTGQVWEGLNGDLDVAMFLFLHVVREYRYGRNATWNDWVAVDLLTGRRHELRMWRDSPLEEPGPQMPKWRRVA